MTNKTSKVVDYRLILLSIIMVVVVLGYLKNFVVKSIVSMAVTQVTGVKNSIGGLSLGLWNQSVRVRDFRLYNPKEFPQDVLLYLPEIRVDFDLPSLLKGKLYFPMMVIDLKELTAVRDNLGKLNVDSLRVSVSEHLKGGDKPLELRIDALTLSVGRVVFKDFSKPQGQDPTTQIFNVNFLDKTFKDINSAQQLVVLVIVEAMKPTAIHGAQIYGQAALANLGFIPKNLVTNFLSQDDASGDFAQDYERVFKVAESLAREKGSAVSANKNIGLIKMKMDGADVQINVNQVSNNRVKVVVSARKMLLPQAALANGILSGISERLQ